MTWEIAVILLLIVAAFASFVWERVPSDVTAITLFSIILIAGFAPADRVLSVLSNPAPLTIGAMFILSAALVKCGAMDIVAGWLERAVGLRYAIVLLIMMVVAATLSAFINNTPVVVVFLPVVLGLARKMKIPASKFLIPLSYAAVLGGTCTLIGTSTNLIVSGILVDRGLPPISMFELAKVGIPFFLGGALYLTLFAHKLLPVREMLTAILSEEERREYITEAFVRPGSAIVGRSLNEAGFTPTRGIRVLEIVRGGVAVPFHPKEFILEESDRLILACRIKGIAHARGTEGLNLAAELHLGLEQIAAHEGAIVEGVIAPNSPLIGRTVAELNFRQRYRMVVLAVHRRGRNVREKINSLPLEFGDILLMMGTDQAIEGMRGGEDILLIDRPPRPARSMRPKMPIVLGSLVAVVGFSTIGLLRIEIAAVAACAVLFITGCLKPKEGYASIEWNILFLIYGMLAMGVAMETTGTSAYLVERMVSGVNLFVPAEYQAIVLLASFYLLGSILTEVLSNNAVAALMTPLAIGLGIEIGVDPRPFVIAVCFAASASFATPIGYQTNTYVYGVGGYRFSDFIRIGLPLNLLCFLIAIFLIPRFWPF